MLYGHFCREHKSVHSLWALCNCLCIKNDYDYENVLAKNYNKDYVYVYVAL